MAYMWNFRLSDTGLSEANHFVHSVMYDAPVFHLKCGFEAYVIFMKQNILLFFVYSYTLGGIFVQSLQVEAYNFTCQWPKEK